MTQSNWQQWSTEQLEREYSPSAVAPHFMDTIAQYQAMSADALAVPNQIVKVTYGLHPDEFILVNPAKTGAAMLVFIHGGYWQELSARDSLFSAQAFGLRNVSWAAINYGLAPDASLATMVARCKAALTTLAQQYPQCRFVLAGSSAGAHLVASCLADQTLMQPLQSRIIGCVLLSGVYDLSPLVETYINKAVGLTKQTAVALSPMTFSFNGAYPVLIALGERETTEFKRQSNDFASHLKNTLLSVQIKEIADRDHFDIVFDLSDANTFIGQTILSWIG